MRALVWRLVEWRLKRHLSATQLATTLGDLEEDLARRRRSLGAFAANAWLIRESWSVAGSYRAHMRHHNSRLRSTHMPLVNLDEVRLAVRRLVKRPAASLASILTLACGIGAAAATYALVSSVLLRPLPVESPERLMVITGRSQPRPGTESYSTTGFVYPTFTAIRDNNMFARVVGGGRVPLLVGEGGTAQQRVGYFASHDFFEVLGVRLALGSGFRPEDDQRGAPVKVIVAYRYWQRVLNADPQVIGRTLTVANTPATIVGVTPQRFRGLNLAEAPDLYLPLHTVGELGGQGSNYFAEPVEKTMSSPFAWLTIIGRLAPGTAAEPTARLNAVPPDIRRGLTFSLTPVNTAAIPEPVRPGMTEFARLLSVTVVLLLLIGGLTVGMLLLIRTEARRDEFAMCLALGATRGRLAGGVVVEGALLSMAGAGLAVPVAWWLFRVLGAFQLPGGVDIGLLELNIDVRTVLAAAMGAVAATLLIAAIAGAVGFSANVADALRARAGATPRLTRRRTRSALVIVQVAVTLVLLAGAGVFARSLIAALNLNAGFETSQLVTGAVPLAAHGYTPARAGEFFQELRIRLTRHPAVRSMAIMRQMGGMSPGGVIRIDDQPRRFPSLVSYIAVDEHYFSTVGLRTIRGRDFTSQDTSTSPLVVIVSESFGRMLAPGADPVGHRITETSRRIDQPFAVAEIIGVVPDVVTNVAVLEPLAIYYTAAQKPTFTTATVVLRASDSAATAGEASSAIRQIDLTLTPPPMLTMQERIGMQMGPQRFGALVLGVLGVIAVLLTILGAYVLAESMAAVRQREMGIRAALGASRTTVGGLLLSQTLRLVGAGLVIGLGLAWAGASTIRAFLFQVQPLDPLTLVGVAAAILVLALAVSLRPAVGVMRMDVARILRED